MFPEIEAIQKWLRRRAPHASTAWHYAGDLRLFFIWANKTPPEITILDVDRFIQYCSEQRLATTTINRRLHTLHAFYTFLAIHTPSMLDNPVLPAPTLFTARRSPAAVILQRKYCKNSNPHPVRSILFVGLVRGKIEGAGY
jgi:site-specific recombinase XerD